MVFALAIQKMRQMRQKTTEDVSAIIRPFRLSTMLVGKQMVRLSVSIIAMVGFGTSSFALGETGQGEVSKSSALGIMQIGSSEFMTAEEAGNIADDINTYEVTHHGEDSVIIIAYQHTGDPDAEWEELLISESEYVKFIEEGERQKRNLIMGGLLGATSAIAIYCVATRNNNNSSDGCNAEGVVMSGIGGLFLGGLLGSSL